MEESKVDYKEHTGVVCFNCGNPILWDNIQQRLIHECKPMGVV